MIACKMLWATREMIVALPHFCSLFSKPKEPHMADQYLQF